MRDFALQRKNMVENQVRPSDITDRRILRALSSVPRERFVPASRQDTAYRDCDLPLDILSPDGTARALTAPRVLAMMIQALALGDGALVLHVGCASGYATAVLAHLAQRVVAIESDRELGRRATATLAGLDVTNARIEVADLTRGAPDDAPFDAILVEGRVEDMPRRLLDQLKDGAVLAAVLSGDGIARLTQWRRAGETFDSRSIAEAAAPALPGFVRPRTFVL